MAQPLHQTKSGAALQIIRSRILDGEYNPGDQLRAEILAVELGMSATPVREALRMLQADRLVHHKAHHGIVVAGVSAKETREIYLVRALLEAPATELATPGLHGGGLGELEQIHEKLTGHATAAGRHRDIGPLNAKWHWTIYRASGSEYLCEIIEGLWERFPWRTMWAKQEDLERSVRDHNGIMAAIRDNDAPLAAARMREHVLSGPGMLLLPDGEDDFPHNGAG